MRKLRDSKHKVFYTVVPEDLKRRWGPLKEKWFNDIKETVWRKLPQCYTNDLTLITSFLS